MADPQDAGATQSAVEQATPLNNPPPQHAALQADVRALAEHLLDQKPENGDAPLMAALGNPHVVRLLLEHGANPNTAKTDDGSTPLWVASQEGHVEVAQLLLDRNADPNAATTDDGCTPLHMASENGHLDVAQLLLGHNADPNAARTDTGSTPLCMASENGHLDVARCCLTTTQTPTKQRPASGLLRCTWLPTKATWR